MNTRSTGLRSALALGAAATLAATLLVTAGTVIAANPSANLDQCANDPAPSPSSDGCNSTANQWVNGNLGASKSIYLEGDSIPYRLRFDNLGLASHTVTIEWDTTKSGKHALDYIDTYNQSVLNANPCLGVTGCSGSPSTFAIPNDPQVTGAGVTPIAGSFSLWGGTVTSVSAYSYPNGSGFTGDKSARISITFTASVKNPVLAWGGHISTRIDWGATGSAVTIPGSPYHTRLIDLDGSGGNQDRSLSADAVVFPGSITIIKDAVPNDAQDFSFTTTGGLSPASFSLDDDSDITLSNTRLYSAITTFGAYTITEGTAAGWTLTFPNACSVTSPNGGSQSTDVGTRTVSITLKEGENVTCTFVNTAVAPKLRLIKSVTNDNGGTAGAGDWTLTATGSSLGFSDAGNSTTKHTVATGVQYTLTESSVTGYAQSGNWSCTGGTFTSPNKIQLALGDDLSCTVTNDDIAPKLTLIKNVLNDNGGSAAADDWTFSASGTAAGFTDAALTAFGPETGFDSSASTGAKTMKAGVEYTLSESSTPAGYTAGSWVCDSGFGTLAAAKLTLGVGADVTCRITNDDNGPKLELIKNVLNDNGGTAVATDWTFSASGSGGFADQALTLITTETGFDSSASTGEQGVKAGVEYTLSESTVAGYTAGSWVCDSAKGTLTDGKITLALGDDVTCRITNDDGKNIPTGSTTMHWYVSDDASFTIRAGASDAGDATITFKLYSDDTCATQVGDSTTIDVTLNGAGDTASAAMTQAQAISVGPGTYYWVADYTGDAFNTSKSTTCGSEVTTISDDSPTP